MPLRSRLLINSELSVPRAELRFQFVRSSGPGGQNVNKVNSKAVLQWPVSQTASLPDDVRRRFITRYASRINHRGELVIASQRYRDQAKNIDDCLQKLRDLILAVATPPSVRKKTRKPRWVQERRLREKRETAHKKQLRRSPPSD